MIENDLALEEEIRRMLRQHDHVNKLLRERQFGSLEDVLTIIEISARDARRRLRELCSA